MKTFIITIEIEHTDRSFQRPEVQQFVAQIGSPQANWVKEMRKAFKQTILGEKAYTQDSYVLQPLEYIELLLFVYIVYDYLVISLG